jgi:signal transduction histidine kinase
MAHSVRNPLTSVKMRLFSLNRSLSMNSDQAEDFAVISEEIGHIDTIVQNFLEFARPPKLKMQKMSPSIVVNMMIQLLTHRLKSYDVTVNVVRDAMLPDITCDPEQLKEVFVNLVENACQAMGRGGLIIVTEQVRKNDSGKDTCLICVKDTGPGLPANILEKIFNPFFTTKEEGTGLGLSIAERIIENHGGKISVKSAVGEGTSFYIELPVAGQNR